VPYACVCHTDPPRLPPPPCCSGGVQLSIAHQRRIASTQACVEAAAASDAAAAVEELLVRAGVDAGRIYVAPGNGKGGRATTGPLNPRKRVRHGSVDAGGESEGEAMDGSGKEEEVGDSEGEAMHESGTEEEPGEAVEAVNAKAVGPGPHSAALDPALCLRFSPPSRHQRDGDAASRGPPLPPAVIDPLVMPAEPTAAAAAPPPQARVVFVFARWWWVDCRLHLPPCLLLCFASPQQCLNSARPPPPLPPPLLHPTMCLAACGHSPRVSSACCGHGGSARSWQATPPRAQACFGIHGHAVCPACPRDWLGGSCLFAGGSELHGPNAGKGCRGCVTSPPT